MKNIATNAGGFNHLKERLHGDYEVMLRRHPYISFLIMLTVLPTVILTALFACMAIIMLPISYLSGWL